MMIFEHDMLRGLEPTYEFIEVKRDRVSTRIVLSRPEKKNALHPKMVDEIAFAVLQANLDAEVRAVVIAARGDTFCAGADLKAMRSGAGASVSTVPAPAAPFSLLDVWSELEKPMVAVVEGPVYAGGHLLVGGCHRVIATSAARFSLPEVRRGLWPMQVMSLLSTIMTRKQVLDFCIRGTTMSAAEALSCGLVDAICDAEDIETELAAYLKFVEKGSPRAIAAGLRAYRQLETLPQPAHAEYLQQELASLIAGPDAREGLAAFSEKREPQWNIGDENG